MHPAFACVESDVIDTGREVSDNVAGAATHSRNALAQRAMKRCLACDNVFDTADWRCPACSFHPTSPAGVLLFAPEIAGSTEGYDPAWYEELARLEDAHFWFKARNRLIKWLARRHLAAHGSFLEIGCGTGYVLRMLREELPGWRITGSEALADGFRFAQHRAGSTVHFEQIDATALPYRAEFDAIGAFDVIEHIEDDRAVLREIHAALRPEGLLIASVPQHGYLWSQYDEIGRHFRRYELPELRGKLDEAGFRILETTSFNALLLPLMWLSRRIRRIHDEASVLDELRVGFVINRLLAAVLALEFALVRLGVRWPSGGSRILVARKIARPA